MKNISFLFIAFTLIPFSWGSANANDKCMEADDYASCMKNESARQTCLKAADYAGCMRFETGQNKKIDSEPDTSDPIKRFNKGQDCQSGDLCIGTGKEKDMFGMNTLKDYFYRHFPVDNEVVYFSLDAKDVKVRGEYGRYIDITFLKRYYQNPKSGTSGYSSTVGSSRINCSPSYGGSSISCTSSSPTTINIPGRAATPGGIVQDKSNMIVDCQDRTMIQWFEGRKKYKWEKINEGGLFETISDSNCPKAGTGELAKSDFTKYEKRGIRKSRIRLPNDD